MLFYELWVFTIPPLDIFEEGILWFVDVTDKPELAIEPEDDDQRIRDSEDEKVRKKLERTAKKKERRNNLRAPVRQAFTTGSTALLSSRPSVPALLSYPSMSAFLSSAIAALSCLPLPTLSNSTVPALSSPPILTLL